MELGGSPQSGEKERAESKPKAAATDEQPTSSDPEPAKDEPRAKDKSSPPPSVKQQEPSQQKGRPHPLGTAPSKQELQRKQPPRQDPSPSIPMDSKATGPRSTRTDRVLSNRDERRVGIDDSGVSQRILTCALRSK